MRQVVNRAEAEGCASAGRSVFPQTPRPRLVLSGVEGLVLSQILSQILSGVEGSGVEGSEVEGRPAEGPAGAQEDPIAQTGAQP